MSKVALFFRHSRRNRQSKKIVSRQAHNTAHRYTKPAVSAHTDFLNYLRSRNFQDLFEIAAPFHCMSYILLLINFYRSNLFVMFHFAVLCASWLAIVSDVSGLVCPIALQLRSCIVSDAD